MHKSILSFIFCLCLAGSLWASGISDDSLCGDSENEVMQIYTNPFAEKLEVNLNFHSETEAEITLEVLDAEGKCKMKDLAPAFRGNNTYTFDFEGWPAGEYQILITSDGFTRQVTLEI